MISKACLVGIYQRKLELIAQQGIDLLVLVPPCWKDERGEIPLERAYTDGYRLEVLPLRFNGSFHCHYYVGLGRQMRAFRPDVVHIDEEPYNLSTWQTLYHARRVGTKSLFFSWQNINRRYPPPFRWGERWVLNNADYALVGTDSAGQVWREKGYRGPMATIPQFGTDAELFVPAATRPERPFTIGYIGRLVEEKGLQVLLDALAQMDGDWRLRILGAGPFQETLQVQIDQLGIGARVHFEAWLPSEQVPPYYQNLDVFVLPSLTQANWKEQFGRVLVEAMASGVPVIGSDSGAIPGVIGDAGLVTPEGDVMALKNALAQLRDDSALYARLQESGRTRFLAHFTHEQIADDTVQVYRAIADK